MDSISTVSNTEQSKGTDTWPSENLSKKTNSIIQNPNHEVEHSPTKSDYETENCNTTSGRSDVESQIVTVKHNINHGKAIDYQDLANKLHGIAITAVSNSDSDCLSKEETVSNAKLESETESSVKVNGTIKTPPPSPMQEEPLPAAEPEKLDPLVTVDEYGIRYLRYESELQMPAIMALISKDLSEPYSIYTYRYFIHNWPNLCFLAMKDEELVGAVVCKIDPHKRTFRSRGYIGMLAVDHTQRRRRIGSKLVRIAIEAMISCRADEIVLETEVTNKAALQLYERLGFIRDKKLHRYYLNGVDAIRLKLWIT